MFDLHITCTKDIADLKITFTDGTSVEGVRQSPGHQGGQQADNFPDVHSTQVKNRAKITLPDVPDVHRGVKVADELQNLEL